MNSNPYSAPQSQDPHSFSNVYPTGEPQDWSATGAVERAWHLAKPHWPLLMGAFLLEMVLTQLPAAIFGNAARLFGSNLVMSLSHGPTVEIPPMAYVGALGQWLVRAWLGIGMMRILFAIARNERPKFALLFSGGDRLVPVYLAQLVIALAAGTGVVFLVVPGVVIGLGLMLTQYYIVDQNLSMSDALNRSWAVTRGQRLDLFGFSLLCGLVVLGGLIACGIGIAFTASVAQLAIIIVYFQISGCLPVAAPTDVSDRTARNGPAF